MAFLLASFVLDLSVDRDFVAVDQQVHIVILDGRYLRLDAIRLIILVDIETDIRHRIERRP